LDKPVKDFYKNSSKSDGFSTECMICVKMYNTFYYTKNNKNIKKYSSDYYYNNKEKCDKKNKEYSKKYRKENPDKVAEAKRAWGKENPNYKSDYNKRMAKNDIQFRIKRNLRARVNRCVRGMVKNGSAVKDLGCTVEKLKKYLEKQFYSNSKTGESMTWENYGLYGWHIDHVKPLISFDLSDREQFLKACNYTNLQPLWAQDNLAKGHKIL